MRELRMKKRILIVEDEIVVTTYLEAFFSRTGFDVETAQSISGAREAIERKKPDVVLLDLLLGDEDGLDLLDAIKTEWPQLRSIIVTGVAPDDALVEDCRQRGAAGYVTKESTVDHLLMVVQQVIKA